VAATLVAIVAATVAASSPRAASQSSSQPSSANGESERPATACPEILVLILDPDQVGALRINGTNSLNVPNGRVHANSTKNCGIQVVGTPSMFALRTTVVGTACYPTGTITGGPVLDNQDPVLDLLANVLPTVGDWNSFKTSLPMPAGPTGAITTGGTFAPGYYPNGLDAASTSVVQLNPGSYMFGSKAKLGGSATLVGNGVTLFLDKDVELDIAGSGAGMTITPPDSGPYFGITMFTHRFPSAGMLPKIKLGGGGPFLVEGVTYAPKGELVMGGIPGKEIGAIVAWQANTEGTTGFTVTGADVPRLTPQDPVWCELGGGLAGVTIPALSGSGPLTAGSSGSLELTQAAPSTASVLFASLRHAARPFKGGLLSTIPIVFQMSLGTSVVGSWTLPWSAWPPGLPPGFEIYFQVAVADPAAVQGVSISNLLRAKQP